MRARSLCGKVGCAQLKPCTQHSRKPAFVNREPMPTGWTATRKRILHRDSHLCQLCGAYATDVDHITPRSQGGSHDTHNLRAVCQRCHRRKTGQEGRRAREVRS